MKRKIYLVITISPSEYMILCLCIFDELFIGYLEILASASGHWKIFRNFKKSYLQETMQQNLWVSLIFDAIEEIDSRHVPLLNRSFHQRSFTENKSGFSTSWEEFNVNFVFGKIAGCGNYSATILLKHRYTIDFFS